MSSIIPIFLPLSFLGQSFELNSCLASVLESLKAGIHLLGPFCSNSMSFSIRCLISLLRFCFISNVLRSCILLWWHGEDDLDQNNRDQTHYISVLRFAVL